MKTINDAAPGSSPANTGGQRETSPHSPDVQTTRDSSSAEGVLAKPKSANEQLEELLAKEGGEAEGDSPTTETGTEAGSEDALNQDESGAEADSAGSQESDDLSQAEPGEESEDAEGAEAGDATQAAAEKAYTERAEWQSAMKLVPAEKQKEMRAILRPLLEREQKLTTALKGYKPAVVISERMRKAVGDEGVENAVALVELWHSGDERAEGMLTELLTDLQTRRGARLGSPDLVKKAEALKQKLDGGLIEQADYDEHLGTLKELERTRAQGKQTAAKSQEAEQAAAAVREEQLVNERTEAINAWERKVAGKDLDYPRLQIGVINRAKVLTMEKMEELGHKRALTAGEMVKIMEQAYTAETAYVKGLQPRRKAITPVMGRDSSANSQRKPMTDMEKLDALIEREG